MDFNENRNLFKFNSIYYEPDSLNYELGKKLFADFKDLEWIPIESHNSIKELQQKDNSEFGRMKRILVIGTRKTHKYSENHKISDFLVPYTSSGCSAMCLYCYLVCNYNKCSYLRLFVNREKMMDKLIKTTNKSEYPQTFEIGSNSDLILENMITNNLEWTIEEFAKRSSKGRITFPTKFDMVDRLLNLNHQEKVIFRMSVNPPEIIKKIEIGTALLEDRITAINKMCDAGYSVGILIAPVILVDNWKDKYLDLIDILADKLSEKVKNNMTIEVILMTYSYIHRAINSEAFPNSPDIYNKDLMTGRGRGKYCYKNDVRYEAEEFLRAQIDRRLGAGKIVYIS